MAKRTSIHMGKKRFLQIAEVEIERLREANEEVSARAEYLEAIARMRFLIMDENRNILSNTTLEQLAIRSTFADGDVLELFHFTGKIIVGRV